MEVIWSHEKKMKIFLKNYCGAQKLFVPLRPIT